MKNQITLNILLFVFACLMPAQVLASDWKDIGNKLAYKKIEISLGGASAKLHALKFSPADVRVSPLYNKGTSTAKRMTKKSDALLVMNANFFDADSQALGLVVIDRKVIHPIKDISWWAVFCVKNHSATILSFKSYRDGACEEAIQAGPRLVVNGNVSKLKIESSRKTAVGLTPKGEVVFVVSEGPIPIVELAQVFKKPESQNGLNCPNALNLDGGSSTQIYVKSGDFILDVPSFVRVPVGIGVFTK